MEPIKHRITHYWSHRAEAFQTQRIREFEDEKHERWLREFHRYIPQGRPLRVLDLGTGTGFFALVFAAEGHEATGIDLTPDMIDRAGQTAEILGLRADFAVMDAEEPDFAPESFDVLVTRNLTWTLPHIERAGDAQSHLDAAAYRKGLPGVVQAFKAGRSAYQLRRGLQRGAGG